MEDDSDLFAEIFVYIIVAILYYFFRANIQDAGNYFISKPIFEILMFFLVFISGKTVFWISRYYMPHVTANNFSGSILGRPIYLTDTDGFVWAVFNTGESLEPFHMKGKLATLVIPASQLNRAGKNYVARTFVKKTPISYLRPIVSNFLVHNSDDFNIEKIYFGKYSEEFRHEDPKSADYEAQIENLHSQIYARDSIIEKRNELYEEMKNVGELLSGDKRKWYQVFSKKPQQEPQE